MGPNWFFMQQSEAKDPITVLCAQEVVRENFRALSEEVKNKYLKMCTFKLKMAMLWLLNHPCYQPIL